LLDKKVKYYRLAKFKAQSGPKPEFIGHVSLQIPTVLGILCKFMSSQSQDRLQYIFDIPRGEDIFVNF
jgi:hypothetical protein